MTTTSRTLRRLAGASVALAGAGALAGGTAAAMPVLAGVTSPTGPSARTTTVATSPDVAGRGVTVTVTIPASLASVSGPTLADLIPAGMHYVLGSGRVTTSASQHSRDPRVAPTSGGTLLVWRDIAVDPQAGATVTFGLRPNGAAATPVGATWSQVVSLHRATLAAPQALATPVDGGGLPTPAVEAASLGQTLARQRDTVPVVAASAVQAPAPTSNHVAAGTLAEQLTVVSAADRLGSVVATLWLPQGLSFLHVLGPTPHPDVRTVHLAVGPDGLPVLPSPGHAPKAARHRHHGRPAPKVAWQEVTWTLHRHGAGEIRHLDYLLAASSTIATGAPVLVTATSALPGPASSTVPSAVTSTSRSVDVPLPAPRASSSTTTGTAGAALPTFANEVTGVAGTSGTGGTGPAPTGSTTSGDPFLSSSSASTSTSTSSSSTTSSSSSSSSTASKSSSSTAPAVPTSRGTLATTGLDATRIGGLGLALVVGGLGVAGASFLRRPRRGHLRPERPHRARH